MEPGDYATNVLSCNTFAAVTYEYLEIQAISPAVARKQLHRLEAECRLEGKLVHCDPDRDGIWSFTTPTSNPSPSVNNLDCISVANALGIGLVCKEKGTYEPANLARSKQMSTSTFSLGTPSASTLSPSSLDGTFRNAQAFNSRSVHQNASLGLVSEPSMLSPGARTTTGQTESPFAQTHLHEYLISAVLGSIVFQLCRLSGFLPFNSRTLMLLPNSSDPISSAGINARKANEVLVVSLDVSITSLGSLVVKAHSDFVPNLRSLSESYGPTHSSEKLAPGAALWLAPGGIAATYRRVLDDKTNTTSHASNQIEGILNVERSHSMNALSLQSWQSKCLEWLSGKGLDANIVQSGGWVLVRVLGGCPLYSGADYQDAAILEDVTVVAWPARLCFHTSISTARETFGIDASVSQTRDPLYFAESWFSAKDERAEMLLKRQKERQMAESLSREQAEVEYRALQSHHYSPIALRRSSNAGAIYPTPPDAPHHLVGVTPSFDGTVSTPGNPNLYPSNDGGITLPSNPPAPDVDIELWGSSDKKDQHGASESFHVNDNDNDNLFGDIEEGDFFGTDVTDADFSFFDQPNDIPFQTKSIPAVAGGSTIDGISTLDDGLDLDIVNTNLPEDIPEDVDMQDFENALLEPTTPALPHVPVGEVQSHMDIQPETKQTEEGIKYLPVEIAPPPPKSPPFNKETVFRQLFPGSVGRNDDVLSGRNGTFKKIDFEKSLASVNQKYSANGQFDFLLNREAIPRLEASDLPTTDYLESRRKASRSRKGPFLARILGDEALSPTKQPDLMDHTMDSDSSSRFSDQDDLSDIGRGNSFTPHFGSKTIWSLENNETISIASPLDNTFMIDLEHVAGTPRSVNDSHLLLFDAEPADWPLTSYFVSPEPVAGVAGANTISDSERVAAAQILADQAVSGTFRLPGLSVEPPQNSNRCFFTRGLLHNLVNSAKGCLEGLTACTMRAFLDIQGVPAVQGLRLPPRPIPAQRSLSTSDLAKISNPFSIPPPQLALKRSDAKISVLPSAVTFWDNLGLSPSQGTKDIAAVCVYPNSEGIGLSANAFLDQMRGQYESFRFGTHERITSKELVNGLVPFTIDPLQQTNGHYLALLKETVGRLGRVLASHGAEEKNFVVYFVYPVNDAQLLVHICSAFQHLFNLYKKALAERKMSTLNELVLQLIPLDFIASPTGLVVQASTQYSRLAMEVYDRCIDFSSLCSSPAVLLDQPLPKIIDFKLTTNPSASLLQENTCLHIAYAQSIDDRWVTAAWTDNRGTQQMTASYCLGRKNEPLSTPFSDVANEIWETTLSYISHKKIHWRIMITRVGVMNPSEIECWTRFASVPTYNHFSLTLVTVKTDPSLLLLPSSITLAPSGNAVQLVVTPASTPQPSQSSIISPEHASTPSKEIHNAATPGEASTEPDNDACLVDYTDQSWGAVLSHRLNNSNSLLEFNPALVSGYLIKRGGINLDDPPIVVEVNIIHSDVVGNPRTFHESLLREILGYYRGLGTLARARGIVDPIVDCRPWHVAAVEKAVKCLYMLM